MKTLQLSTSSGKGKVVDIEYSSISNTIMVICHDFAYKITDIDRSTAYFLAPEHYKKLAAYKSVAALVKYAQANQIQPQAETPCPVPAPAPAKSAAKGQGILFLDVETTDRTYKAEIVEIAIVDSKENIIFHSLVKPSRPIPKMATKIHGISDLDVRKAPSFADIWDSIIKATTGYKLLFYNANFDTRMITQSCKIAFDTDQRLDFSQLFPKNSVISMMLEYSRYWSMQPFGHHRFHKLVDACSEQSILLNDLPKSKAISDAIKIARLHKSLDKQGWVI